MLLESHVFMKMHFLFVLIVQTKPEIRGASLLNCVLLVSRCSDGVWDPEKWHASLYPTSERSSPVDGFKKDFADDRVPLKRRIPGKP